MFKMRYLLLDVLCCVSVFVYRANCNLVPYPGLNYFSISNMLGECYVMYDESEIMPPFYCRRPANLERQSCVELLDGERQCLGLKTPGNETIEFICKDTKEELFQTDLAEDSLTCFRVYSANNTFKTICQEFFPFGIKGIRTPANFIILFEETACPTSTNAIERNAFSNFVNNFSFDSEIRSCFKVYNPDQVISPYTCLNKDIQESCINVLPAYEDCLGIITPNSETVILDCPQGNQRPDAHNCFKIYTPDNVEHTACKEAVEERCVGITTPSNLTVLLECYYCKAGTSDRKELLKYYDPEDQRHYRKFVKTYIDDEYLGKHSYLVKIDFEVFRKEEYVLPQNCNVWLRRPSFYGYWLPNTSCYGITLDSNETVILECTHYQEQNTPGCFTIASSDMERNDTACIRALDERCVGITTPQNLTVAFGCYPEKNCDESAIYDYEYFQYLSDAESYQFRPMLNACYEIYNSNQDVVDGYSCLKKAHPERYSCIDWIPGQKPCLGLKVSKKETIEFACGDTIEEVLSSEFPIESCLHMYDSNKNVIDVCITEIGEFSIGITTPNNLTILFDSFFCSTNKSISRIEEYNEFVENFRLDPNMTSCYKIYAPHQEVSPYTCFSREADDACISVLDNEECMGITTPNNETIVLNCGNKVGTDSGCFEIHTPDNKVHVACQEKLEESCVGITTPSQLRVLFDCHTCMFSGKPYNLDAEDIALFRSFQEDIKNSLRTFKDGNYMIKSRYYVYKADKPIDIISEACFPAGGRYYDVHVLRGHNNCRGITMDNLETIVLECPNENPEKSGCFEVYTPIYGDDNKITGPEQKVQKVCVRILNERCIGIITSGRRILPLYCLPWKNCR